MSKHLISQSALCAFCGFYSSPVFAVELICVTKDFACKVSENVVAGVACSCTRSGTTQGALSNGNVVSVKSWPVELDAGATAQINRWKIDTTKTWAADGPPVLELDGIAQKGNDGCPSIWDVPPPDYSELFVDKNGASVVGGLTPKQTAKIYETVLTNSLRHYEPVMNIKNPGGGNPKC